MTRFAPEGGRSTRLLPMAGWREALPVLRAGGLVVIPTDTVYGLAALPRDRTAVERLYAAKDRPSEQAVPLLVGGLEAAEQVAVLTPPARRLCRRFWPGGLTLVLTARPEFSSPTVAQDGSIAVRMPAYALLLDLISASGGVLTGTSANLRGEPAATSAGEALRQLDGRVDLILDGGISAGGVASTVVRIATSGVAEILRQGIIPRHEIEGRLC